MLSPPHGAAAVEGQTWNLVISRLVHADVLRNLPDAKADEEAIEDEEESIIPRAGWTNTSGVLEAFSIFTLQEETVN